VSKVIKAPLPFVYKWCTDFREDDNKITGSKNRRKILQQTLKRVVYVTTYFPKTGEPKIGVNLVTLRPPNSWHLEFIGEEDDEEGDYRLTRLAAKKTRLDMRFSEKYKVRHAPTQAEDMKHTEEIWDKYAARLEKDYRQTVSS
jgi:hypothetical protein